MTLANGITILDAVDNLTKNGVKIEIAFDEASIQKFLIWGVVAALISAVITTLIRKALD